jgi:hypothetical protein
MKNLIYCISMLACVFAVNGKNNVIYVSWGTMQVIHEDGSVHNYKDCKVFPSGSKPWDWRQTGTKHVPGIQVSDIEELIDQADIIILSRGVQGVLQTKPDTIAYLKNKGKEYYIELTEEAVNLYNNLTKSGKRVAALFHSTC